MTINLIIEDFLTIEKTNIDKKNKIKTFTIC